MRPAGTKAPLEHAFALAVCLFVTGMAFLVEPAATRWVVFGTGVFMTLSVLVATLYPVKD